MVIRYFVIELFDGEKSEYFHSFCINTGEIDWRGNTIEAKQFNRSKDVLSAVVNIRKNIGKQGQISIIPYME